MTLIDLTTSERLDILETLTDRIESIEDVMADEAIPDEVSHGLAEVLTDLINLRTKIEAAR